MPLKGINKKVIEEVAERQKRLQELCDDFNSNINKLIGKTGSPIILSMLASLSVLMEVVKDNLDFTRSGFDLFLDEIESLSNKLEQHCRKQTQQKRAE